MDPAAAESNSAGHALTAIQGVPDAAVRKLQSNWLETAEEVLAVASSTDGAEGLKKLLVMDDEAFDGFLAVLREGVGQVQARAISARGVQAGGSLGAKLTEEQKQRFGIRDTSASDGGEIS